MYRERNTHLHRRWGTRVFDKEFLPDLIVNSEKNFNITINFLKILMACLINRMVYRSMPSTTVPMALKRVLTLS